MIPILFSEEDRLGGDDILANTLINNGVVIAQVVHLKSIKTLFQEELQK